MRSNITSVHGLLAHYLPLVSRTFALNIKRLGKEEYEAIGLAYLICRILDTVEDAVEAEDHPAGASSIKNKNAIKVEAKLEALESFHKRLARRDGPLSYEEWSTSVTQERTIVLSTNTGEQELFLKTHEVMGYFENLDEKYRNAVRAPILKMAAGMATFIRRYKFSTVKILKTYQELEEYCSIVAGTVGTMLTGIFSISLTSETRKAALQKRSEAFGRGLQLINILKDFGQDQKRGWIYIPYDLLQEHKLSPADFIARRYPEACKRVQLILLARAEQALQVAFAYMLELPKQATRHRLFCWLPLIMAAQTARLLRQQPMRAGYRYKSKISRRFIYFDLLTGPLFVRSDTLLKLVFRYTLKNKKQAH